MRLDAGGPHDIGDLPDLSSNERLELGGGAAERNDANAAQPLAYGGSRDRPLHVLLKPGQHRIGRFRGRG